MDVKSPLKMEFVELKMTNWLNFSSIHDGKLDVSALSPQHYSFMLLREINGDGMAMAFLFIIYFCYLFIYFDIYILNMICS